MLSGCRNSYELNMERGEYYYNLGEYEDAALEYKSVINHYPHNVGVLDEKTIHMLANAHHNLAVIYLKRGAESENPIRKVSFLEQANTEAKRAYNLYPKDAYKDSWDSIKTVLSISE